MTYRNLHYMRDYKSVWRYSEGRKCAECDKPITNENKSGFCNSCGMKGERSPTKRPEVQAKMSGPRPHIRGPRSFLWKGGTNATWHRRAWELFGKDHCQICGMSLQEHTEIYGERLSMHCFGDFQDLRRENWICLCWKCHENFDLRTGPKKHAKQIRRTTRPSLL